MPRKKGENKKAKETKEVKETKEKKPNVLFDIINAIFINKSFIESQSNETLKQNFFMINRRMAIQYPLQAQTFNNMKVNPVDVIKFWSSYLYNGTFPPRWVYTAGAVKSKEKKEQNKTSISLAMRKAYCDRYNISMKDLDTAMKMFPDEYLADMKDFEMIYNSNKEFNEENRY